jgi:MFS family permease
MVAQFCDILALLPVGALADRRGARRVLGMVLLVYAASIALIGFGSLPLMVGGCALFGLSMAGWMLPLGLLRTVTPPAQVAWRTALYRVGVDGGMFLGPFLSGLLVTRYPAVLPAVLVVALVLVAGLLLRRERAVVRAG